MKIEIEKTIKTSKEIELPYYCSNGWHAYKVFSEEYCISVYVGCISGASIGIAHAELPFANGINAKQCTKEVFQKMYDEALAKINEALEL